MHGDKEMTRENTFRNHNILRKGLCLVSTIFPKMNADLIIGWMLKASPLLAYC